MGVYAHLLRLWHVGRQGWLTNASPPHTPPTPRCHTQHTRTRPSSFPYRSYLGMELAVGSVVARMVADQPLVAMQWVAGGVRRLPILPPTPSPAPKPRASRASSTRKSKKDNGGSGGGGGGGGGLLGGWQLGRNDEDKDKDKDPYGSSFWAASGGGGGSRGGQGGSFFESSGGGGGASGRKQGDAGGDGKDPYGWEATTNYPPTFGSN